MDPTEQVYESEARGWQVGLYEDIKQTLRAPIVNSIWRVQMYHVPRFLRYAWGQLKPIFRTREFGAFSVAYRDRLLSGIEDDLPRYDPAGVALSPSSFTELAGQLATFDVVGPRLAVLFAVADRRLNGRAVGTGFEEPADSDGPADAATAPFPEWLDADRGRPPTMLSQADARDALPGGLASEFDEMVPSVYRCLAQWPPYLERAWDDLEALFESGAYATACEESFQLVETYLDRIPYTPQIDPEILDRMGFDEGTVTELRDLFATFRTAGASVLPQLSVYAATVGAAGEREALSFG